VRTKINRYSRGLGWLNSYDQNWNAVARPKPPVPSPSAVIVRRPFFVRPLEKVSLSLHVEQECVKNRGALGSAVTVTNKCGFRSLLRVGNSTFPIGALSVFGVLAQSKMSKLRVFNSGTVQSTRASTRSRGLRRADLTRKPKSIGEAWRGRLTRASKRFRFICEFDRPQPPRRRVEALVGFEPARY